MNAVQEQRKVSASHTQTEIPHCYCKKVVGVENLSCSAAQLNKTVLFAQWFLLLFNYFLNQSSFCRPVW